MRPYIHIQKDYVSIYTVRHMYLEACRIPRQRGFSLKAFYFCWCHLRSLTPPPPPAVTPSPSPLLGNMCDPSINMHVVTPPPTPPPPPISRSPGFFANLIVKMCRNQSEFLLIQAVEEIFHKR